MAPEDEAEETSIAFNQSRDVVVAVNEVAASSAVRSAEPAGVMYEVTCAPLCWLGRTFASGMYRLTARSVCARTLMATGSLWTLPPAGTITLLDWLNRICRLEPAASAAPCTRRPTYAP